MRRLNDQAHADNGPQRKPDWHEHEAVPSKDGWIWGGPGEAIWVMRLLHGAPPPRESTGTRDVLVVRG